MTPRITATLASDGISRRKLAQFGLGLGAAATLPIGRTVSAADGTPHFFLNLTISGGLDASYLFDARPLQLTDKNRMANYLYKNAKQGVTLLPDATPITLMGSNGQSALRTKLTDPLMKHWDRFSVINGVCMATNGFEGHGNNMYFLFTNSANPGHDSYVPMIGAQGKQPLESVHVGGFEGDGNGAPSNFSGSIQLFPGQGGNLANVLKNGPQINLQSSVMKHVMNRMAANATGTGLFSVGAQKAQAGLQKAPALAETLKNVSQGTAVAGEAEIKPSLDIALAYFKGGVTSAMTIVLDRDPVMDTHGSDAAQDAYKQFTDIVFNIDTVMTTLRNTPYDAAQGLSMLDVTTLLVTTEFSRTMTQFGGNVDATGTDHNPLNNSVLIAGKGIKGGLVIGQSDMQSVNESGDLLEVSGAHKQLDQSLTKIMGKPFDFAAQMPKSTLAETFQEPEYLTFASVANTLMDMFGVPSQSQFRVNGTQALTLKSLLI